MNRLIHRHSIAFRFTLWYLALLGTILIFLGTGVFLTLSRQLHHNFDETLRSRANQVARFKDIIPMIAGGVFEAEPEERITFYYYVNDRLFDISHKKHSLPLSDAEVEEIWSRGGDAQFIEFGEVMENGTPKPFRGYVIRYIPPDPVIRLNRFRNVDAPPRTQSPPPPPRNQRDKPRDRRREPPPPRPLSSQSRHDEERAQPRLRPRSERQIHLESERASQSGTVEIETALLIVARPTNAMETVLDRLLHILLVALPITLILSGGGGIFLLKRILNPVGSIVRIAQKIEAEDLSQRIDVTSKDELGQLATTLNHMIERLQKSFLRQKELTGDASHELRTPLAVIQAEATLALQKERDAICYRNALEVIANECDFMSKIIGQLLILARADSGNTSLTLQPVDLQSFLASLCEDVEVLCLEKEQRLHIQFPETNQPGTDVGKREIGTEIGINAENALTIRADKKSLKRLMFNLLSNAMRYTPKSGEITVRLSQKNDKAVISVSDNGIGIPEAALPHIFERFYRVDKARSRKTGGSGLGLAICRSIVEIHGGNITVESTLNQGSIFTVSFPIQQNKS